MNYPTTDTLNFTNDVFENKPVKKQEEVVKKSEEKIDGAIYPAKTYVPKARRYNAGKPRYGLIPTGALRDVAEVYTRGAAKYTITDVNGNTIEDGANNWRKGLNWMDMIDSVQRHIEAWKTGEDIDPDLGTKHLANAAWGLLGLLEYYRIHPEFDNRLHPYLQQPSIGLDIDEVICSWVDGWCKKYNLPIPTAWSFEWDTQEKFKQLAAAGELDSFYLSLKPRINPEDIPFVPACYISHRPVSKSITEKWLQMHNFPLSPVYNVENREDKLIIAKKTGIDIFVDDNYDTFLFLNKNGICTYLMDAPHNKRHSVGYKRLQSLKDLI